MAPWPPPVVAGPGDAYPTGFAGRLTAEQAFDGVAQFTCKRESCRHDGLICTGLDRAERLMRNAGAPGKFKLREIAHFMRAA